MGSRAPTLDYHPLIDEIQGETAFSYLAVARRLRGMGREVVSLGIGQPDYITPSHIREEAKRALDEGFTGYTETPGIPEIREAIAWYLGDRYSADVDPEEVIVTTGAKTAIFLAIASHVRPGDEVIIPDPSYYAYEQVVKLFGGRARYVPMLFEPDRGFSLDMEALESAVSERTRMIVINNPHNPTGSVISRDQVEDLLELARRKGLIILSDEIYDNFLYGGASFRSVMSFSDWRDYVLYVNGFSKTFSMTGWRLGYLVVRRELASKLVNLAVTIYSCPPSMAQRAGVTALRGDWGPVKEMIEEFERRASLLYRLLSESDMIESYMPQGAFYMFPRVRRILESRGISVEELVERLLYEAGVLVIPGTSFPKHVGREHVRISFATDRQSIEKGARLIIRWAGS